MDYKLLGIIIVTFLVIGYTFGRYVQPARVETKIVTQVQRVEVIQHNTTTHEITHPDGTKETIIVDHTKENNTTDTKSENSSVTSNEKPQWMISGQFVSSNSQLGYFYGLQAQRRILGPIFAGAFANTDRQVGLTISLEF